MLTLHMSHDIAMTINVMTINVTTINVMTINVMTIITVINSFVNSAKRKNDVVEKDLTNANNAASVNDLVLLVDKRNLRRYS